MTISTSEDSPLVVVTGSTGNQGGSVIKHLTLSSKPYRIRALTRDASKPKAKNLEKEGVEIFEIDLKPENQDKMVQAYASADIVFAVTNFWEHCDPEREVREGKAMIDAAIVANVKLFIFSGLPSPSKLTNGRIKNIHHFESKAAIDDYGLSKSSDSFQFRTVQAGFFASNVLGQQIFHKNADGAWSLAIPVSSEDLDKHPLPVIDISEYGLWVQAVIENKVVRDDPRPVLACSEEVTLPEILKTIEKKTNARIEYRQLSNEKYLKSFPQSTPSHILDDFEDTWPYLAHFGYWAQQDIHWVDQYLARKPITFAAWLDKADTSEYRS